MGESINLGNIGQRHRSWLAGQAFDQTAHQLVFQDYLETIFTAQDRRNQLVKRITAMLADWSMRPVVEAIRGLRGLDLISSVTFVAGIGDLGRFATPRQLMGYLGLAPSEQSSGERVRRGGITKTGNREARRMLEGATSGHFRRSRASFMARFRSGVAGSTANPASQSCSPSMLAKKR